MDYNKFFQSKIFKMTLWGIAGLIILLLVFKAGMAVGFRKASFSYKWGENYHQNFGGPRGGFFQDFKKDFEGKDFIEAYGSFGQIIKIDPSTGSGQAATLVVKDSRNNVEKIVLIKDGTVIKRFQETAKPAELKVDDRIVVIGEPNNAGQIEAKLIRLLPPTPFGSVPPGPFSVTHRSR